MKDRELVTLLAEDCVQVNNFLFFIARDVNFVFCLNLDTGKVDLLDSIPEEDIRSARLGANIAYWNNELIFTPMKAEKIWIYNLWTREWHGLKRKRTVDSTVENEMFQSVLYENKLFLIGSNYPAIVCLDLIEEDMTYIEEPFLELKEKKELLKDCYFRCDHVQKDNFVYLASCLDNLILKFDMNTFKYAWIKVGVDGNRYSGITWYGKNFWLAPRFNTPIVKWDGGTEVVEIPLPGKPDAQKYSFIGAVSTPEHVIFPGMAEPNTLIITDEKQTIIEGVQEQYLFFREINSGLIVSMTSDGLLKIYNRTGEIKEYTCVIEKEKIRRYVNENISIQENLLKKTISENDVFSVIDFCNYILNKKKDTIIEQKDDCGKLIWEETNKAY